MVSLLILLDASSQKYFIRDSWIRSVSTMTAKDCTARIQFLKGLHMSSASGLYSSTYTMHIRTYSPFVLQPTCEAPSSL